MEKDRLLDRQQLPRELPATTPEQIALKALVDELFHRSDTGAFAILNKICEEAAHERED